MAGGAVAFGQQTPDADSSAGRDSRPHATYLHHAATPIDSWCVVHAMGHPAIVALRHLPPQPRRQVLDDLVICWLQDPPSSAAFVPDLNQSTRDWDTLVRL